MFDANGRHDHLMLVTIIVNRGYNAEILSLLEEKGLRWHLCLLGHGTADSDILDYLGLGETERDIVLCSVPSSCSGTFFADLEKRLTLTKSGNGIAFSIPISSVGGQITLAMLSEHMNNLAQEGK